MERPQPRSHRRILFVTLALLAALCLPQAASACYSICTDVQPGCFRCEYTDDPGSGCRNYAGNCGCYDVLGCYWQTTGPDETASLESLGIVPAESEPVVACTEAPAPKAGMTATAVAD
jgi:hypothetical protein